MDEKKIEGPMMFKQFDGTLVFFSLLRMVGWVIYFNFNGCFDDGRKKSGKRLTKSLFHLWVTWWVIYLNFRGSFDDGQKNKEQLMKSFFHFQVAWWVIYFNFMGSLGVIYLNFRGSFKMDKKQRNN